MLQKFKKHITKEFPFLKDTKLLIAISGGVDSVVLFHLLHKLNYDVSLAHCNFKLRGKESDLDEEFIKNLNQFKKDINSKNNKSIVKKLTQTKKVRSKIIKLKQDIDKPDFGRN